MINNLVAGPMAKRITTLNSKILSADRLKQLLQEKALYKYAKKALPSILYRGNNVPVAREIKEGGKINMIIDILQSLQNRSEDDIYIPKLLVQSSIGHYYDEISRKIKTFYETSNFYDFILFITVIVTVAFLILIFGLLCGVMCKKHAM